MPCSKALNLPTGKGTASIETTEWITCLYTYIFLTVNYINWIKLHIINSFWPVKVFIWRGFIGIRTIILEVPPRKRGWETPSCMLSSDVTTCIRTWMIQMVCYLQRCSVHCSRTSRSYRGRRADTCRIAWALKVPAGRVRTDDLRGSEMGKEQLRVRRREQGSKASCSVTGLSTGGCGLAVPRCRDQDSAAPSVSGPASQERDTPHRYPLSCLSPSRFRH